MSKDLPKLGNYNIIINNETYVTYAFICPSILYNVILDKNLYFINLKFVHFI